jgi:ligand-binding sensor domain-containing protein
VSNQTSATAPPDDVPWWIASGTIYRPAHSEPAAILCPIGSIAVDPQGGVWAMGRAVLTPAGAAHPPGPVRDVIACRWAGGQLWAVTRAGVGLLDPRAGRLTMLAELAVGGPDSLAVERGALWVGSADGGLFRCEGGQVLAGPPTPAAGPISLVAGDGTGALWVGVAGPSGATAELFELRAGRWRQHALPRARTLVVRSVVRDARGALWVGAIGGLWRWAGGGWAAERPEPPGDGPAAPGRPAGLLWPDRAGRLWASTLNGLAVREAGVWRRAWLADPQGRLWGLGDQITCGALADSGALWLGTMGGALALVDTAAPLRSPAQLRSAAVSPAR